MSKLKKTALHNLHLKLHAKMVPFAGYEMPVSYKPGIIQEHLRCRSQAGLFDISHMGQCFISGASAAQYFEKLTPSNIVDLQAGQLKYALLTNNDGGIIDDIILFRQSSGFLVIVNAACKEKDFLHFKQHLPDSCEFTPLQNQALLALQGPAAADVMEQLNQQTSKLSFMQGCETEIDGMPCFISRCGYTGEDGFEISIANQYAEVLAEKLLAFGQVSPIGLGARDTLRLEAGLSLYGHEISESISPVEAGLKWTFRKQAAEFSGANIIQSHLKSAPPRKRVGLVVEGKIPIRQNTELFDSQGNNIGFVTSGSFSPCLEKPIALALIDSTYSDQIIYAKVRNRTLTAHTSPLPFIPHRYQRS